MARGARGAVGEQRREARGVAVARQQPDTKKSSNATRPLVPYNKNSDLPLYTVDQVPQHLSDNPYILTGYRVGYSTLMCVRSMLSLHNETLNIWTHFVGFWAFLVAVVCFFGFVLFPRLNQQSREINAHINTTAGSNGLTLFIFGAFSFGCLICLLCSAAFHTFLPHRNTTVYAWAHALDYFGITFLVVGSFLPMCYVCFACEPFWQWTYLIMICFFGIIGLLGPFFRHWVQKEYAKPKILFYVCMVGSGLFPITHLYALFPGNVVSRFLEGLMMMMVLYAVGLLVYVFQIPELFFPGKFDLFLSSHQIWHMFVLAAAFVHFFNSASMYINLHQLRTIC